MHWLLMPSMLTLSVALAAQLKAGAARLSGGTLAPEDEADIQQFVRIFDGEPLGAKWRRARWGATAHSVPACATPLYCTHASRACACTEATTALHASPTLGPSRLVTGSHTTPHHTTPLRYTPLPQPLCLMQRSS